MTTRWKEGVLVPYAAPIDPESLARLRTLVNGLHNHGGETLPLDQLIQLAEDVRLNGGLTIDFQASQSLGHPMVVLRVAARAGIGSRLAGLTKREHEIAGLIAEGLSNKQIARRLFLSLATIKDHVHRILAKTNMPNRAAVAAAYRQPTADDATRDSA